MSRFRKDRLYLAKYHLKTAFVLILLNMALMVLVRPDVGTLLWFLPCLLLLSSPRIELVLASVATGFAALVLRGEMSSGLFLAYPAAFAMALSFSGLIHCASHGSIRPRFLNRFVGEAMGWVQLSGFADWKIIHVLHHAHTDDPLLDPHPPQKKKYWEYTTGMRQSIGGAYLRAYSKIFGQTPQEMKAIKLFLFASKCVVINKIALWYLLLGPRLFATFFTASIAFKMLQFSWLNWAAHRPTTDGFEIRNLNHGFYKVANFFSFGLYVHENHHLVPTLFNPSSLARVERSSAQMDAS